MIGIALLLAAAAPPTAVDAERAFAGMAQTEGQWTAFRAYAAADGVMFVPETVNAQQWLKDRKDPPVAVMWWPGQSWVSCDGNVAVNTGPWLRDGGTSAGYFTTVWVRQRDGGWKWLLDHGDGLEKPRTAGDEPEVRKASCSGNPKAAAQPGTLTLGGDTTQLDYRSAASRDGTLLWSSQVNEATGARTVTAYLWNGTAFETVLEDKVAAAAP